MKRVFFWLIIVICSLAIVNLSKGIMDLLGVEERVNIAEENVAALEEKNQELEGELAWRSTEAFAEQEIRNKLKLAKPDEVVVRINEDLYLEREEVVEEVAAMEQSNWQKWWELFE
jgi:cell division protein FtsB